MALVLGPDGAELAVLRELSVLTPYGGPRRARYLRVPGARDRAAVCASAAKAVPATVWEPGQVPPVRRAGPTGGDAGSTDWPASRSGAAMVCRAPRGRRVRKAAGDPDHGLPRRPGNPWRYCPVTHFR